MKYLFSIFFVALILTCSALPSKRQDTPPDDGNSSYIESDIYKREDTPPDDGNSSYIESDPTDSFKQYYPPYYPPGGSPGNPPDDGNSSDTGNTRRSNSYESDLSKRQDTPPDDGNSSYIESDPTDSFKQYYPPYYPPGGSPGNPPDDGNSSDTGNTRRSNSYESDLSKRQDTPPDDGNSSYIESDPTDSFKQYYPPYYPPGGSPGGPPDDGNSSDTGNTRRANSYTIQVKSDTEFCSFMPPNSGDNVAATENSGVPFCTDASLGGQVFPEGFITSAHFLKTDNYEQVTGTINREAYGLEESDGGGQYDHKDIQDVTCNGYKYFVNLIEPDANRFCIRCCDNEEYCNTGLSAYGCPRVVPGDYS